MDKGDPITRLTIYDQAEGGLYKLQDIDIDIQRPDVSRHYDNIDPSCGFTGNLTLIGLAGETELLMKAITNSGSSLSVCTIRLQRKAVSTSFVPSIHPIILTTIGRTGSTWLMQLLGRHPSICVAQQHPYETFALEYWLHLVREQLINPIPCLNAVDRARFNRDFLCNADRIDWFHTNYDTSVLDFCLASIEAFYEQIGREQKTQQPGYFAEKVPYFAGEGKVTWRQLSTAVRELYPRSREIVLVRDFRDMVLSALHFGARDEANADISSQLPTAYLNVTEEVAAFSEYYRRHRDYAVLVRYEALLLDTRTCLKKLFSYLDLDASDALLQQIVQQQARSTIQDRRHITSRSAAASTQRWKTELSPALQKSYTEAFKDELKLFGYY